MYIWKKQIRCIRQIATLSLLLILALVPVAHAAQSSSTNYQVNEVFFGTGGELNACSTTYCSKQAVGETAVGNTKSTNYQAQAGFNTDRTPSLTFIVNATNISLGTLTAGVTARANATFSVKSYLSSGYVVQTYGAGPTNGSYVLSPMTTTVPSNNGTEQFGMNLVANTSPGGFGANPAQAPDSTFGFGQPGTGYGTVNQYRYNNGDTIAQSVTSSGETDFTISYVFNTINLTPGGTYTMNQILVATATF